MAVAKIEVSTSRPVAVIRVGLAASAGFAANAASSATAAAASAQSASDDAEQTALDRIATEEARSEAERYAALYPDLENRTGVATSDVPLSAPNIVASAQSYGAKTVTLRRILGKSYSTEDAAAIINAAMPSIAAAGMVVTDPDRMDVYIGSPLRPVDNFKLDLSDQTHMIRTYADANPTNAMFSPVRNWTFNSGVMIHGGRWVQYDSSMTGRCFNLRGPDLDIVGVYAEYSGGSGMAIIGDITGALGTVKIEDCEVRCTDPTAYGTDGFRVSGGRGGLIKNCYAYSGDDCFPFAPVEDPSNSLYGKDILDWTVMGCFGESKLARPINFGGGTPALMRRLSYIGVKGIGGDLSLKVGEGFASGVYRQYDDLDITACRIGQVLVGSGVQPETPNGVGNARAAQIVGGSPDQIGLIRINDTSIEGNPKYIGLYVNAEGARVALSGFQVQAVRHALLVASSNTQINANGSRFTVSGLDDGKPSEETEGRHIVNITPKAKNVTLALSGGTILEGVTDRHAGVNTSGSDNSHRIIYDDVIIKKTDGQTLTKVANVTRGNTLLVGRVRGDVDDIDTFTIYGTKWDRTLWNGSHLVDENGNTIGSFPDPVTSTSDTTLGRYLTPAYMGLGATNNRGPETTDCDAALTAGHYRVSLQTLANGPYIATTQTLGVLTVLHGNNAANSNNVYQELSLIKPALKFMRTRISGTWSAWIPINLGGFGTINSDASATLFVGVSGQTILDITTITANRNRDLAPTGAIAGSVLMITRTGAGAFNLNVRDLASTTTLTTLAQNQWAHFAFDGTTWVLTAKGSTA